MQMTSTTQQVQVQVPAGVGPGGAIEFSNPMAPGQMLGLSVPAGMKAGDTFAVTLPASQALPYQAGPPAGGQPHQVLIQMQGVPTSAVIPAIDHEGRRMSAGGRFTVATANGQTVLVNRKGFAPGQQIQFMSAPMVGVPTAPRPPDDTAVAQYEQLLAGVTQIIVQDMRRCNEPTVEMAALRMFGKTAGGSVGLMGTLYLVINEASPSHTSRLPPKVIEIADARDSGSAELQLSDGRVVMQLSNPEWRGAQIAQEVAEKRRKDWLRPEVQMMDREDLVRVTDETVRSDSWCSDCAPPLDSLPQTRVSHPHSTDETLKQGFQQVAPASANSQTIVRGKLGSSAVRLLSCSRSLPFLRLTSTTSCRKCAAGILWRACSTPRRGGVIFMALLSTSMAEAEARSQTVTRSFLTSACRCRCVRTCWPCSSTESPSTRLAECRRSPLILNLHTHHMVRWG